MKKAPLAALIGFCLLVALQPLAALSAAVTRSAPNRSAAAPSSNQTRSGAKAAPKQAGGKSGVANRQTQQAPAGGKAAIGKRATAGRAKAAARTASAQPVKRSRTVSRKAYGPWTVPTFAPSTEGDVEDGEDPVVRRAAVQALGPYNGAVVAVDPLSGRILAMVNQRLALTGSFQPCSTVKLYVALAALSEGIIARDTVLRLSAKVRMNLTDAMALSNNPFFGILGAKLGYERFAYYARLFGLGEPAGLDLEGESPGRLADAPPKNGGMWMMASFGEGIAQTPLQLAAFLAAVANGGTLYYLQRPRSEEEVEQFAPRVKRHLDIARWIPELRPGLVGAVEYGTARRAFYAPEAPICGKTGTCTEGTTHLGWFGSFSDFGHSRLVVVVLMTGGHGVSGPTAAEIAGAMYRSLFEQNYFAQRRLFSPAWMIRR